jgi:rhodanese-related sulfurtransferase
MLTSLKLPSPMPPSAMLSSTDPLPLAALPAALAAGAVLVDVREEDERALFGAIPGAIALPLLALRAAHGEWLTPEEAELLEDAAPASPETLLRPLRARPAPLVLCFCAHGQRARRAARLLAAQGFPARALAAGFSDLRAALGPTPREAVPIEAASPAALTAAA